MTDDSDSTINLNNTDPDLRTRNRTHELSNKHNIIALQYHEDIKQGTSR